jgi:hypothetical protein
VDLDTFAARLRHGKPVGAQTCQKYSIAFLIDAFASSLLSSTMPTPGRSGGCDAHIDTAAMAVIVARKSKELRRGFRARLGSRKAATFEKVMDVLTRYVKGEIIPCVARRGKALATAIDHIQHDDVGSDRQAMRGA